MLNTTKRIAITAFTAVFVISFLVLEFWQTPLSTPKAEAAQPDVFPSRPITIYIPHKAGSSTDIIARALQPYLQKALGKASVVIENQEGGGGNAAHMGTYKAAPDGYTIELSPFPSAIMGELVKGGRFKTMEFTFLHNVTGADYNGIFVKYDSPYRDLKGLVEAAKKQKITLSGSGIGTNGHMAMKLLEKAVGVKFEYVSYDGGTEAAVAVAGGHTMSGVGNVVALKQLAEEKKIRILAVIGERRHPAFPNVPTAIEQGYKNVSMEVCVGVFGPPKMPVEIAKKLEDALDKAVNDPGFKAQAEKLGSNIQSLGSADFARMVEKIYIQTDTVKNDMKAAAK